MEMILEGYARVSDILRIFQGYAYVPKEKLKKAQDVGTDIHEAIEWYYKNNFKPLEGHLGGYFESFLKWAKTNPLKVLFTEKRIYDDVFKITGKLDLLAEINGQNVLIDFKTGSWAHPEIWRLQGTFYRSLIELEWLTQDGPFPPEQFLFIQLMKDGSAPIIYKFDYSPNDWGICLSAINCYRYFSGFDNNSAARL